MSTDVNAERKAMATVEEVRSLLDAVDALDGIAEIPYRQAMELAKAVDAVRVAFGHRSRLPSDELLLSGVQNLAPAASARKTNHL